MEMSDERTITIPRLDGESSRAYAARVEYVTMGPQRSYALVGQRLGKSGTLIDRWASTYEWVESARRYDGMVATLAIQDAATRYRADLEAHREDAMQYGKELCTVAVGLLGKLKKTAEALEVVPPSALPVIVKALTTGMDLQAHALRVAELLPRLTPDDSE